MEVNPSPNSQKWVRVPGPVDVLVNVIPAGAPHTVGVECVNDASTPAVVVM